MLLRDTCIGVAAVFRGDAIDAVAAVPEGSSRAPVWPAGTFPVGAKRWAELWGVLRVVWGSMWRIEPTLIQAPPPSDALVCGTDAAPVPGLVPAIRG